MNKQALKKSRIRKGDMVVVIAGRDRGKSGKVLSVDPAAGKIVVEKLNMIKRHTKPNQKVKQGGILEREAPLAISNVLYLCPVTKKPTRLGVRTLDDGRRIRFSRCIARRPAGYPRRPARSAKRLPQKILDLSVQAAQIIVGPALNALEDRGVDAKEKGFPFRHGDGPYW